MMIPVFTRIENIEGKGENAGYQDFLIPQYFQNSSYTWLLKFTLINSFFTDNDTRSFCEKCRSKSDYTECAL